MYSHWKLCMYACENTLDSICMFHCNSGISERKFSSIFVLLEGKIRYFLSKYCSYVIGLPAGSGSKRLHTESGCFKNRGFIKIES